MKRCRVCQFQPCRCEDLKDGCTLTGVSTTGWPLKNQALAVHPDQVEQANARAKRHGISVQYDKRGRAIIPDAGNYRKLLKLEGMHNKDAFLS